MCSARTPVPGAGERLSQEEGGHYAHYDHVMLLEDRSETAQSESKLSKVAFLATCAFVSMFGGFALNLAVSGRRYRSAVRATANPKNIDKQKVPSGEELEDPVLLATRALGWGSLYAMLGSGAIGLTAYYLFRV